MEVIRAGGKVLEIGPRTLVMGILNLTPDSFSGDGISSNVDGALSLAVAMAEAGADIIDVGGESTRPGASPILAEEELRRVIPVLDTLARHLTVPLSIDTRKPAVADRAIQAGATIVNDIWGLRAEPEMAQVVAKHQPVGLVVMHNQKGTQYRSLVADIKASLRISVSAAVSAGIPRSQVMIDPGFGFGKTPAQNLEIVQQLKSFADLGQPVLLGASNKSTLGFLLGGAPVKERRDASLAIAALAIAAGVDILRVHDVKGTDRVRRVADPIVRGIGDDLRGYRSVGQTL